MVDAVSIAAPNFAAGSDQIQKEVGEVDVAEVVGLHRHFEAGVGAGGVGCQLPTASRVLETLSRFTLLVYK